MWNKTRDDAEEKEDRGKGELGGVGGGGGKEEENRGKRDFVYEGEQGIGGSNEE